MLPFNHDAIPRHRQVTRLVRLQMTASDAVITVIDQHCRRPLTTSTRPGVYKLEVLGISLLVTIMLLLLGKHVKT